MLDVMVDLETMGLRPDAAIVSIGAVAFDETSYGATFECPVNLASAIEAGGTTDQSTVDWWSKQPAETRAAWQTADASKLVEAMTRFNMFLLGVAKPKELRIWGNGSDFDVVMLTSAYRNLQADPPWQFYNVRCFRTLKNVHKLGEMPAKKGLAHRSLDDAINQVAHLHRICALKGVVLG